MTHADAGAAGSLPALDLLRVMETSRQGDRREGILLRQSRGWFHVSGMGHEAIAALAYLLRPDDYLFPFYRDRAICLARGLTTLDLALAYFARRSSQGGGRSMPSHYCSRAHRIFSAATPTASQCLPAAGAAWGLKLSGQDAVVTCHLGDGAACQGEYFEAVAFAVQESLPVVFVLEDNQYAISTPTAALNPHRLRLIDERLVVPVNGRDPFEVFEKGAEAIARARQGGGPTILWCELDRLSPHTSSDDHRIYRSAEDLAAIAERDPIPLFVQRLTDQGALTRDEWAREQKQIEAEVEEAYRAAEEAALPGPDEGGLWIFGDTPSAEAPPLEPADSHTMVSAIHDTLEAALGQDERVILFGEDIADPKGGVFGFTKGLSTRFPGRVFNAPLAEATIVGAAVGLAAVGYRPVFEVQFIDFISPAWNQLVTNLSTLRWRSSGEWTCPVTLLAPAGAYLPGGGAWHSQTNEGIWAHVPGLRVFEPSTPQDAAGLLWTAIRGDDPTLVLVPKHIFRKRVEVARFEAVPAGSSAVRRTGSDVTLVTWGNGIELAEQGADAAAVEGISVEIVDLRSIAPCDWDGVAASLAKTGRLVVLQEDGRTCGFGQAVIAEMTAHPDRWDLFLSAPQLVARADVPVPFCPALEYAVLPDLDDLIGAIRTVMA